jgi:hypothetical protein
MPGYACVVYVRYSVKKVPIGPASAGSPEFAPQAPLVLGHSVADSSARHVAKASLMRRFMTALAVLPFTFDISSYVWPSRVRWLRMRLGAAGDRDVIGQPPAFCCELNRLCHSQSAR